LLIWLKTFSAHSLEVGLIVWASDCKMALCMTTSTVLGQTLALRKGSASPRSSRVRSPVTCMAKSPLALDQPKRLWETGNELW
jgi:hypothetical protein